MPAPVPIHKRSRDLFPRQLNRRSRLRYLRELLRVSMQAIRGFRVRPPSKLAGDEGSQPNGDAALGPAWSIGNRVELLPYGESLFPALKAAWRQSRRSIWLETYIFHDDQTGLDLAAALVDAARRGVQVRVMVDGLGSWRSITSLQAVFASSGVEFMVYRPWRRWLDLVQRGHWRRLHRKICVIDGNVAFIGGINFIDDRLDIHHGWSALPRLDYAVRVEGVVARQALWNMRRLWLRTVATGSVQRQLRRAPGPDVLGSRHARKRYLRELLTWGGQGSPQEDWRDWPEQEPRMGETELQYVRHPGRLGMRAALVVRDNFLQRRAIERAYIQAIDQSRVEVLLVSPYFYPGMAFRDSLKRAAARGVRVTLLLQGRADYRAAAWAARALYRELLTAGVKICEYQPAYLHGKVAVVDTSWATVGSSNIDPLSLLVNREANVMVRDPDFVQALAMHVRSELALALPIDGVRLRRQVAWWIGPLVAISARLFIALAGGTRRY